MRWVVSVLISFLCLFIYSTSYAYMLPPSKASNAGIRKVFSPEEAAMWRYASTWSVLPKINLIQNKYNYKMVGWQPFIIEQPIYSDNISSDNGFNLSKHKSAYALLQDLSDPLSAFLFDNGTQQHLYLDVSSILISHIVRQATHDFMDLVLLTDEDNENMKKVSGVEFGLRPTSIFGFRLKVKDNDNKSDYGIEFGFYPSVSTEFKISHQDNNTTNKTGIELNYHF